MAEHTYYVTKKSLNKLSDALPEVQDKVGKVMLAILKWEKKDAGNCFCIPMTKFAKITNRLNKPIKGYKY